MVGFPERGEAAPYYFKYIDRIAGDDIVGRLETQLDETIAFASGISEEKSLHRYALEKWSIRQVLSHVSDAERVFLFRAFWFARGFDSPLPSFEESVSAGAARADEFSWASHVEEFRGVRLATLAFFRILPAEAWMRSGVASDNSFYRAGAGLHCRRTPRAPHRDSPGALLVALGEGGRDARDSARMRMLRSGSSAGFRRCADLLLRVHVLRRLRPQAARSLS